MEAGYIYIILKFIPVLTLYESLIMLFCHSFLDDFKILSWQLLSYIDPLCAITTPEFNIFHSALLKVYLQGSSEQPYPMYSLQLIQ